MFRIAQNAIKPVIIHVVFLNLKKNKIVVQCRMANVQSVKENVVGKIINLTFFAMKPNN